MKSMYSMRSPAVKRLMKEAQELREPTELYFTQPLEDNLFEWHFTIRGPENSDFDGGIYHGRIILPAEYPMKPPNVILLTPNGRFETNKKICLSISGHHPESWQPSWSIRTALLAIVGFMPTHGGGAIGSLDYPSEERKKLAKRSSDWKCEHCGNLKTILKPVTEASKAANEEAKELASQINFRGEKSTTENKSAEEPATNSTNPAPITTPPNTPVNQTFPNLSTPPGQFPFPSFPFPPQFQNMAAQQQQGSNFMPRFPYPPQFMPAMFPNSPFGNPLMPGNQFPGFPNSPQTLNSSQNNVQTNNSPISSVSSWPNSEATTVQNVQSSGNTQKTTSKESATVDSSKRNETSTNGTEVNSQQRSEIDTVSSQTTSNSASTNQSETIDTLTDSNLGLRQRNVDQNRGTVQERPNRLHYADIQPEERQTGLRISTVMICVLLIGILLLVFRRIYLQRMWKLPF